MTTEDNHTFSTADVYIILAKCMKVTCFLSYKLDM